MSVHVDKFCGLFSTEHMNGSVTVVTPSFQVSICNACWCCYCNKFDNCPVVVDIVPSC